MKHNLIYLMVLLLFSISCKDKNENQTKETTQTYKITKLSDEEVIIENLYQANQNFIEENVDYTQFGVEFKGDSFMQAKIADSVFQNQFSINLVFSLFGKDNAKLQTLIALADENEGLFSVPFIFYITNKRITGVIKGQSLWAENYDYKQGMSSTFYDSPEIEYDKFYSLTLNFMKGSIYLYVNGELYQKYNGLSNFSFNAKELILGAYRSTVPNSKPINQFEGIIRNLEIYRRELTDSEIEDYFLLNKNEIEDYNAKVDMKLMETNK